MSSDGPVDATDGFPSSRILRRAERLAYQNQYLQLYDDDVSFPNGSVGTYLRALWNAPYGVGVLPVDRLEQFLLIQQFSYARDCWGLQIVKGMGVEGMPPEEAAKRELAEEAGLDCGSLQHVLTVHLDPAFIVNPMHLYIAHEASRAGPPRHEPAELIGEVVSIPRAAALTPRILDSISDAATLVALFAAERSMKEA